MLKYVRYILSTRRAAKIHKQHIEQLHKMSEEDVIGIALWHCKDWLEYGKPFATDDRFNLTISNLAPNAGELIKALREVYDVVLRTEDRYIREVPSWYKNQSTTVVADQWLIDEEGYFVELESVVKQLHDLLTTIHSVVNDPKNEDFKYHYTKKPKGLYENVTVLIKHFQ